METAQIHGGLTVGIPEGFHVMDDAELKLRFPDGIAERWAIRDEERHIVFTIIWHDAPSGLLAKLVSTRSLAERVEKLTAKSLKHRGFRLAGRVDRELCGTEAKGFSCGYTVQDVSQSAEIIVLRNGLTCYTLYCIMQSDCLDQARPAYEEILASLSF